MGRLAFDQDALSDGSILIIADGPQADGNPVNIRQGIRERNIRRQVWIPTRGGNGRALGVIPFLRENESGSAVPGIRLDERAGAGEGDDRFRLRDGGLSIQYQRTGVGLSG